MSVTPNTTFIKTSSSLPLLVLMEFLSDSSHASNFRNFDAWLYHTYKARLENDSKLIFENPQYQTLLLIKYADYL